MANLIQNVGFFCCNRTGVVGRAYGSIFYDKNLGLQLDIHEEQKHFGSAFKGWKDVGERIYPLVTGPIGIAVLGSELLILSGLAGVLTPIELFNHGIGKARQMALGSFSGLVLAGTAFLSALASPLIQSLDLVIGLINTVIDACKNLFSSPSEAGPVAGM